MMSSELKLFTQYKISSSLC